MRRQGFKDLDKECPICGGIIWGKGERVLIEGAKITVCRSCAQHGIQLHKKRQNNPTKTYDSKKVKKSIPKRSNKTQNLIDETEVLVSDFSSRIRKARTANNLTQEQFAQKLNEKPSLLRRIEAGKVEPTIKLAKKIEIVYKIKILEKADKVEINLSDNKYIKKSHGSSLGDIAFIKKKK